MVRRAGHSLFSRAWRRWLRTCYLYPLGVICDWDRYLTPVWIRRWLRMGTVEPGYAQNKDDQLKRLRRVEGQVRGIARMVEEDA